MSSASGLLPANGGMDPALADLFGGPDDAMDEMIPVSLGAQFECLRVGLPRCGTPRGLEPFGPFNQRQATALALRAGLQSLSCAPPPVPPLAASPRPSSRLLKHPSRWPCPAG